MKAAGYCAAPLWASNAASLQEEDGMEQGQLEALMQAESA